MPQVSSENIDKQANIRQELLHVLEHFEHTLPAQAPIRDFVHHNTLHGFEHLKFPDALKAARELTGAYAYWPQEKFRELYQQGRINDADLTQALLGDDTLKSDRGVFQAGGRKFCRKDIYQAALLYPIKNISFCQLTWQINEANALGTFQANVAEKSREKLLQLAKAYGQTGEATTIHELWKNCIEILNIDDELLHPEDLMNLSSEQAEKMFSDLSVELPEDESEEKKQQQKTRQQAWQALHGLMKEPEENGKKQKLNTLIEALTGMDIEAELSSSANSKVDSLIRKEAWQSLDELLQQVGDSITLRSFLKQVSGVDIQTDIARYLQPYLANWLDQGFAAWNADDRNTSFYQSWKKSARDDKSWLFEDIPDWTEHIDSLPDDPVDTIIAELSRMGIPKRSWATYIERLALDLPGWSGMFYWRHSHQQYDGHTAAIHMMDYLAVRLITEHIYARRLCRELWLIEANISTLRGYFRYQYAEFLVRFKLQNQHLPDYLIGLSQQLIKRHTSQEDASQEWQYLSHLIWTWQQAPIADKQNEKRPHHEGWRLFVLAQHLSLCSTDILRLTANEIDEIFTCLDAMKEETAGFLLLKAYEHHYREKIFTAIVKNQGRGTWKNRQQRPEAQIIFCMDDREEGVRRHLEHINPAIETLGAAAFFGVVMNWKALNNDKPVILCPVVVTPEHEVTEIPAEGYEKSAESHKRRYALRSRINDFIHQETRRNLFTTAGLIAFNAPLATLRLLGKIFIPLSWGKAEKKLERRFDKETITRITSTADEHLEDRSIENNQQGFTLDEQANIVEGFLQNNGLLSGFSHFVILMGHYSNNLNNPHTAAYGCGACGGKYSGPNGRAFAAMANNPNVRNLLFTRNIKIPDDCCFIGAEHDTCNEDVTWYDADLIPESLSAAFKKLGKELKLATKHSAHERCRKLASAPKKPSLTRAFKHIAARAVDFSQARPELGHATNAVGFIGRRYLSQGTFMDRRSFLISYDASIDPEGKFLERILLTAGPVGAGINLEYYFSTVNNEKYGCSSKIVHNLAGLFGVMEGTSSDLRTGLPQQMVEIHEPMRLQLMLEAELDVITAIYQRQPSIQQLVGNGWLLLSAKSPNSDEIHTFDPDKGWQAWQCPETVISTVKKSSDWYTGHTDHLPPALIERRT